MKKFLKEYDWLLIWFGTFYVGSLLISFVFLNSVSVVTTGMVCGKLVTIGSAPDYMLYFKAITSAFGVVILLALGVYWLSVFLSKFDFLDGFLYWWTGDEIYRSEI